jgi:hypothetical protein
MGGPCHAILVPLRHHEPWVVPDKPFSSSYATTMPPDAIPVHYATVPPSMPLAAKDGHEVWAHDDDTSFLSLLHGGGT